MFYKSIFQQAHAPLYDILWSDSKKPLYSGCTNFTWLSTMLDLVNLKAIYGWSDKSFTELLDVLEKMLPNQNTLLKKTMRRRIYYVIWVWSTWKYMYTLMIAYCIEMSLHKCASAPIVGDKKWRITTIVMRKAQRKPHQCWYLPIIPRFKRLCANWDDAKNLTWHANERKIMIDCFGIWLILHSGRKLIPCFLILGRRQETLGLDLL